MRLLKWEGTLSRSFIRFIHSVVSFPLGRSHCVLAMRSVSVDQNAVPIFAPEISVASKSTDDSMGIENRCIGGSARAKEKERENRVNEMQGACQLNTVIYY